MNELKTLLLSICCVPLLFSCGPKSGNKNGVETKTINIYTISDLHSAFLYNETEKTTGLSRIGKYLIDKKNFDSDNTLLFCNGNMVSDNWEASTPILNSLSYMGIDAYNIGENELRNMDNFQNYGIPNMFPTLGANIYNVAVSNRPSNILSSCIFERDNLTIGVMGCLGPEIEANGYKSVIDEELIKSQAIALREAGADINIALVSDSEIHNYEYLSQVDKNGYKYADAILFANEYSAENGQFQNSVPYMVGGRDNISNLQLNLRKNRKNGKFTVRSYNQNLIKAFNNQDFLFEDEVITEMFDDYRAKHEISYIEIANKEELQKEWYIGDDNRKVRINVYPDIYSAEELLEKGTMFITSNDERIIKVEGNEIIPVGEGTTEITIRLGDLSDYVEISVSERPAISSIAEVKKAKNGETVYFGAIYAGQFKNTMDCGAYVGDGKQGLFLNIPSSAIDSGIAIGDKVIISGIVDTYNNAKLIHSVTAFSKDETISVSPIVYEEVTSFETFDDSRVGDFVKVSGTLKEDIIPDLNGNKDFTLVLENNEEIDVKCDSRYTSAVTLDFLTDKKAGEALEFKANYTIYDTTKQLQNVVFESTVEPEPPLASGTINNSIPEGFEYIPNNPSYSKPVYYKTGALKLNFLNMGVYTNSFTAQTSVDVSFVIDAINENSKSFGDNDTTKIFTITAYNEAGDVVSTGYINEITKNEETIPLTLTGEGIVKVSIVYTNWYITSNNKAANLGLLSVKVKATK